MSYNNIRHIQSFLLLFLLINCSTRNSSPSQQRDGDSTGQIQERDNVHKYLLNNHSKDTVRLQKVAIINDSLGVGTMGHIAVDDEDRVYIAEGGIRNNRQTIHIYSSNGNYIGDMGKAGAGPGEFTVLSDIQIEGNHLFAYDYKLQRINIFSLKSFSSSETIILNPQSWEDIDVLKKSSPTPENFYVRKDGTFLFGFTEPLQPGNPSNRFRRYYLVNHEGNIVSGQIFKERDVSFHQGTGIPAPQLVSQPALAFDRSALLTVSHDGHIYSAWTEDFLIKVYDPSGEHQQTFYYPFDKSSISENNLLARYRKREQFRQAVLDDHPETWPAINYMLLDDKNRLWVSTITDSNTTYQWWVLGSNGKPIGTFQWPGRRLYRDTEERRIKVIKGGYLYAVETDSSTDLQQVVKYVVEIN